jgi:four helix bundle protein
MKKNIIKDKSFDFAIKIIDLYSKLRQQNEFVISKQLLRSGTSIGANIEEAIAAQSSKEFIWKLSIATKEARETRYWILLLDRTQIVKIDYTMIKIDVEEIINILYSILKTMSKKIETKKIYNL